MTKKRKTALFAFSAADRQEARLWLDAPFVLTTDRALAVLRDRLEWEG